MKPERTKLISPYDAMATAIPSSTSQLQAAFSPDDVFECSPPLEMAMTMTNVRGFIFSSPAATDMPSTATEVNAFNLCVPRPRQR